MCTAAASLQQPVCICVLLYKKHEDNPPAATHPDRQLAEEPNWQQQVLDHHPED